MEPLLPFLRKNAAFLAAGVLLTFASSFGQTFFISVFAGEIKQAYGLTDGTWAAVYMIATLASAATVVRIGATTDRIRVRVLGVVILLGLACAALVMAGAGSIVTLAIAVYLLRLMGQGMMGHVAMVAMARWFVATRGRAVSIAGLGVSLGEALLPLTFVVLMGVFDWRWLWVGAAVFLVTLTPVLARLLTLERHPQAFKEEAGALGLDGRMWTRAEVQRSPLFWAMVPMIIGPSAWSTSFFFHSSHLADAKGWTHAMIVGLFPLFTATSVTTMIVAGWATDRWGSGRFVGVYLLPMGLGFGILAATGSLGAGAVAVIFMGMSQGANNTVTSTFWAEYFGTEHLGSIRAVTTAWMVMGSAVGPGISGLLIDFGISFDQQGWGIAVYFAGASVVAGMAARRFAPRLRR